MDPIAGSRPESAGRVRLRPFPDDCHDGEMWKVKETVNELVRSSDGPYVSVELDDTLASWPAWLAAWPVLPFLITLVLDGVAALFGLQRGRHVVRAGINNGSRLESKGHRYKDRETALLVARRLVEEIKTTGLAAIADWNNDPEHWKDESAS